MSSQSFFDCRSAQNSFIEFAKCLAAMTNQEDIWSNIGQMIFHCFDADVVGFLHRDESEVQWKARHWSLPPGCTGENILTPSLQRTADQVLEKGLLACDSIQLDGPCQVGLFPLRIENQTLVLMLIGHHAVETLPGELLNIYMGTAFLVSETVSRLAKLAHLHQHSDRLQELIAEHTNTIAVVNKNLDQSNEKLSREIFQRHRSEQALRESEREKSAILNGLQEVEVLLLDPEMRIIWTNAGASLPNNRQDEDLRGQYCYKVLQGRNSPCEGCAAVAACQSRRFEEGEILLPDGRSMLARCNPLKNERGEITSLVHVGIDITRRKMVEQELIKRESQLRSIVENALEIIFTLSPQGMISYASPRWTQLIGHEWPDLFGRSFVSFLHPSDRVAFQSLFQEATSGNSKNQRIEFRIENRGGAWRWYSTTLSTVRDTQGRIKEFVGIAEDITDRKQVEEDMRKAREAAEAATRAKTEFLTNMSHEIRTPMTAVLGFAEILLERLSQPEDVVAANTIKRSGEYLLHIIDDILDLFKIESGRFATEMTTCSPHDVINEVLSMMKVRAIAKGLPLNLQFNGLIPQTICTDPFRLRQILINLIGNAIKFTEQGEIRVVVELIENEQCQPLLQCKIIDTGVGMSEEQISKLFEPFTQGDTSSSRKHMGLGLGLALSKRLAGMLGGDISVTSAPGQGSTFAVTVGAGSLEGVRMLEIAGMHDDQQFSAICTQSNSLPRLSGRILLVEDGLDNQRLVSLLLRKAGAEVTIVNNGKEALERVNAEQKKLLADGISAPPYAIILMDMQMPEMDGYEATWRLREMGFSAPIIALTAHAMSQDRKKCLDAGC
ncbi:MAG TPA: ATP-binding protein, partial [Thermoguttaceae bacterium]